MNTDFHRYLMYGYAFGATLCVSLVLTWLVKRIALRWNILDHPGERKVHTAPIPLLGGVAIFLTFYGFLLGHFALLHLSGPQTEAWLRANIIAVLGTDGTTKLLGFAAGSLLVFVLGIVDDYRALSPKLKLAGQIAAAAVLVMSGIRLEVFVLSNYWLSALVTIAWVVLITNSMNLLDNMDGLSGGVSVIAAFSFFLCVQPHEDELVRWLLMIFAGSMAGFLYHNMSKKRIFMGDAGAMFSGYFLATIALLGTFHIGTTPSRIAVAAPLLALSVPLFDTFSVIYIRWRTGHPIMRGDKRHFSHRLVDLGMSPRQAVEFIFLVAAVVGLGAALLPILDNMGIYVILAQTAGIFLLIVLLMNAGNRKSGDGS